MIRRITMLIMAAMLALTMALGGAGAAFAQTVCTKERGTVTCTETTSGKNERQEKFDTTTTTTTKGNETNFSPEPQGTGTETDPCDPCPPGQFK